uniref:Uncharacterized protein n=1 Tax=Trachysalambria curvirostris majanivirus TaxID=2984281 RepID=A0A9C7F760_9VIRU|nr:MAG: hypothetical protein [Trachysalambria curvirostris majanivirus]
MALEQESIPYIYGTQIMDLCKERASCLKKIADIEDTIKDSHDNKDIVEFLMNRKDKHIKKVNEYDKSIGDAYKFIRCTVEKMYNDGNKRPSLTTPAKGYWDECAQLIDPTNIPISCDPRNYGYYYYNSLDCQKNVNENKTNLCSEADP